MTDEQIKNKELIERFPFLQPRNVWTDKIADDYDYSYIRGQYELPNGWQKLFIQLCEDIRQPLIDANYLDKFRFSQIKEKYNSMRCYTFGATEEINNIIMKYEYVSQFICQDCGAPATVECQGWITSYCDDCFQKLRNYEDRIVEPIKFEPIMRVTRFGNGEEHIEEYDVSEIWDRLYSE